MESKTYSGGCHCGAVRYQVTTDLAQVISCNCSNCSKVGYLLSFVPERQFTLQSGEDQLTDYQFNKRMIHHLFCRTCGVHSFGRGVGPDGSATVAINVRCLEGVDPSTLQVVPYDGKNR